MVHFYFFCLKIIFFIGLRRSKAPQLVTSLRKNMAHFCFCCLKINFFIGLRRSRAPRLVASLRNTMVGCTSAVAWMSRFAKWYVLYTWATGLFVGLHFQVCSKSFLGLWRHRAVAPVAYQVILELCIGRFRDFESPRVHSRTKFVGTFSCAQNWLAESARAWVSNTRWKIDEQWDCWTLMRDRNWRQEPGRRDDTCDHGFPRSWKVEVCEK